MFTGIVEGLRPVTAVADAPGRRRLTLSLGPVAEGLTTGSSLAVNGCCLTVVRLNGDVAEFDVVSETLARTALGALKPGDRVNVERCLRLDARVEGHLVQGHVDGVARVVERRDLPGETRLTVELPPELAADPVVLKGSIALDGVSLTVAAVDGRRVTAALIPHTLAITTLGGKRIGDPIHVETDVLGKMVRDLFEKRGGAAPERS
ncbi:MAG TPA: riboflavin synthase [Planctomycetota bacterium]|nr:riboflavin synthase [Planctomycetota bacterium]